MGDPDGRPLLMPADPDVEFDRLRAELSRAIRERDVAIRRQLHAASDGGRWYVADGVNVEAGERLGPFLSEEAAVASVLAWIKWSIDPENVPTPEYGTVGEESEP